VFLLEKLAFFIMQVALKIIVALKGAYASLHWTIKERAFVVSGNNTTTIIRGLGVVT